jgi:hypothetical protein
MPWKYMNECRYGSTNLEFLHKREVSGQLHTTTSVALGSTFDT